MTTAPELVALQDRSDQTQRQAQLWRLPGHAGISSAAVGGGLGALDWVLNIGVTRHYRRVDISDHASEVVEQLHLDGAGSALFTAATLTRIRSSEDNTVRCDATVGISKPTWAADADGEFTLWRTTSEPPPSPGTINIVVQLPVALEAGAAVNAVATATEAKTQAMFDASIPGTGTASDAVVVCWPLAAPVERFAGPRSVWGARLARAVHAAVAAGIAVAPQ